MNQSTNQQTTAIVRGCAELFYLGGQLERSIRCIDRLDDLQIKHFDGQTPAAPQKND